MADHWEINRIYVGHDDFISGCNEWLTENPGWEPITMQTLSTGLTWLTVKRRVVN